MTAQLGRALHRIAPLGERKQRIFDFLQGHPVGVLSTVTPTGEPHGTVIYFAVDENLAVSFLTKRRTRKYDNLKRNAHAMLTVFDGRTQTTLQCSGIAVECKDEHAVNEAAFAVFEAPLTTSESGLPPIAKLQAGAFTAFRIEPSQIRMACYGAPGAGDYNQLFESLESFEFEKV